MRIYSVKKAEKKKDEKKRKKGLTRGERFANISERCAAGKQKALSHRGDPAGSKKNFEKSLKKLLTKGTRCGKLSESPETSGRGHSGAAEAGTKKT